MVFNDSMKEYPMWTLNNYGWCAGGARELVGRRLVTSAAVVGGVQGWFPPNRPSSPGVERDDACQT